MKQCGKLSSMIFQLFLGRGEQIMYKRLLILFLILILLLSGCYSNSTESQVSSKPYYDDHLEDISEVQSKEERFKRDLEFLYKEIKDYYVNLSYKEKKFQFNWDTLYEKYRKELKKAEDEKDFYKIACRFVSELHDGHLYFGCSNNIVKSKIFNQYNFNPPFYVRFIEGKPIIVKALKQYDILGYEVVSINGIDFGEIIDTMINYYYYRGNDESAKSKILHSNKFYDYFQLFPNDTNMLNDFTILKVELRNKEGETKIIKIEDEKNIKADYEAIKSINLGLESNSNLLHHKILKDNIGYINIPNFQGNIEEKVKAFQYIVDEFKTENVKGVIIDVRYNGGGNESFRKILSYLTNETIYMNNYRFRDTERFRQVLPNRVKFENSRSKIQDKEPEESYTKWWSWIIEPSKEAFLRKVPVVVLSNELIFSSASDFVNVCLNFDLATVIGNSVPLSGFGLSRGVLLPSRNYFIRYSFYESRDPDFSHIENVVKTSDIKVEQSLTDFYNEIDTQLECAIDYITQTRKNN